MSSLSSSVGFWSRGALIISWFVSWKLQLGLQKGNFGNVQNESYEGVFRSLKNRRRTELLLQQLSLAHLEGKQRAFSVQKFLHSECITYPLGSRSSINEILNHLWVTKLFLFTPALESESRGCQNKQENFQKTSKASFSLKPDWITTFVSLSIFHFFFLLIEEHLLTKLLSSLTKIL